MKRIKDKTKSLILAFSLAILPIFGQGEEPPTLSEEKAEETYDMKGLWKLKNFDMVVSIQACLEKKLCPEVHWVSPEEPKAYSYFYEEKEVAHKTTFGQKIWQKDISLANKNQKLCGQDLQFEMSKVKDKKNTWAGKVYLPGYKLWPKAKINMPHKDRIDMELSVLWKTEIGLWTRLSKKETQKYPKCTPNLKK